MLLFPNAKINLGLHIINKREDGFHNLETVFLPVPWADILEIIPNDDDTIHFKSTGLAIPGNVQDNFIVKAYHAIKAIYGIGGVNVHLHKNIPIGGGLGGGSSDVAFFVKGINELFDLKLSNATMKEIVLPYGSDCPFFIENKPQSGAGIGNTLEPIVLDLTGYWIALVAPNVHVDTAQAYAHVKPKKPLHSLKELMNKPIATWQEDMKNDFEDSVFSQFPAVAQVKKTLTNAGAMYASMSGSGATCYGIFKEKPMINFPENYPNLITQL
jgi:4-diphosphocytidyl-2-C-methyl-D-erythritol kinase